MTASEVDHRLSVVEAGLQWAWAARHQVRRLQRHERDLGDLLAEDQPPPERGWRSRWFALRSDGEFCLVALTNLVRSIDAISPGDRCWPMGASSPELVEAISLLRLAAAASEHRGRRRRAARKRDGIIDLRDDPDRCEFGPGGTRIGGLALDELEAALEPVLACFSMLERSAFAWEGWRAVDV